MFFDYQSVSTTRQHRFEAGGDGNTSRAQWIDALLLVRNFIQLRFQFSGSQSENGKTIFFNLKLEELGHTLKIQSYSIEPLIGLFSVSNHQDLPLLSICNLWKTRLTSVGKFQGIQAVTFFFFLARRAILKFRFSVFCCFFQGFIKILSRTISIQF